MSKASKLYFWLFVALAILAAFLFWSGRNESFINNSENGKGLNISLVGAIIATALGILFGLLTFVQFVRSRSVAGGLFLTTAISTGVFLGSSQIINAVLPPYAAAMTGGGEAVSTGYSAIVSLAQVGLFAIWFLFLLLTIYVQVSPVKKIDKTLQRIIDGEDINKIRIGKSKQYKELEAKLRTISDEAQARRRKKAEAAQKRRGHM